MNRTFVAIGGTGAKVLESLVHLGAMGLAPRRLMALVVDQDVGNGNLSRTKNLLTQYRECRHQLGYDLEQNPPIFSTQFDWSHEGTRDFLYWSPADMSQVRTLRDYFRYDTLKNTEGLKTLGDACDLLYSRKELNLPWDQGFRGYPSVGAPVMAGLKDALKAKPWSEVLGEMKTACAAGNEARAFLVGSLFGATGASGFPTIARIIRNDAARSWGSPDKLRIGCAPLLPYFQFVVPPSEASDEEKSFARPENFMVNTAAALRFYADAWQRQSDFDAVYLMGNQELDSKGQTWAPGGDKQANAPHFLELYAALGAVDFLGGWRPDPSGRKLRQYIVGRGYHDSLGWLDIPGGQFMQAALNFATFALAYLGFYDPLLQGELEHRCKHLPWYLDRFPSKNELSTRDAQDRRTTLRSYLVSWLTWFRDIHRTTSLTVRLLNHAVLRPQDDTCPDFTTLQRDDLFRATRYIGQDEDNYTPAYDFGYDAVWEELCKEAAKNGKPIARDNEMGKFAYLLYRACSRFASRNYGYQLTPGGTND
jgi:hypothetical protein